MASVRRYLQHTPGETTGRGEVGKVEKELPRKPARAAVLVARDIGPTTVQSFVNIECSKVQTSVKTATPSLPPYLQNDLSKHGVYIREHLLKLRQASSSVKGLLMLCEIQAAVACHYPHDVSLYFAVRLLPDSELPV
uniref:Uncharacterized protein n=1 Tax=Timema poppense TaxID=170557 RepID=A0A7R9DCU0_TIMPO|nr:unnamed protein product [Timema poppensis]